MTENAVHNCNANTKPTLLEGTERLWDCFNQCACVVTTPLGCDHYSVYNLMGFLQVKNAFLGITHTRKDVHTF